MNGLGFRTIGFTVDIDSDDIQNIPNPPTIKLEELAISLKDISIKSRLNVRVDEHIQTHRLNIILSSAAETSFALRAPKDVTYLGLMFGLNGDQSKAAVFRNPTKVLKHSEIRKNVNMGTICM
ncbi:unnamed protein product, partial [Medioppia subpectinata]